MTSRFSALACVALLSMPFVARAAAAAPDNVPPAPLAAPAVSVPYATTATMLATAMAGSRIVAVGDHGIVLLSDDGGKTQRQAKHVPVDVALTSVSFVDARQGWAVGHWGVVLRTTDGGESWQLQRSDTKTDRPLFAVHFFDADHGVAVGLWSLILETADGGVHWHTVDLPSPGGGQRADLNLQGLFVDAQNRLYAPAERGTVLRSDDRGAHWRYLGTGYKGSFWTGVAGTDGTLFVGGLRGSLYRSADHGETWQRVETHSKSSITSLALCGSSIVGVGLDGLVVRSNDGGASFVSDVRADRLPLTAVAFDAACHAVLYSREGVVPEAQSQASAK
ncbi:WD40/YVTN/BNR-like repeat-containing protein [Paraburkholderia kururiensis]|uniref:YCF48-related protein n=1 Tax=Paraburkholderia kururiensis TaxID=984307 RepID=A0ABZ0WTW2_9BURK|nr:YCF48-related protein [Paraburkholderia kururiensis]WQD80840.1 YCF48-related protein [Paraburkholderia kururiensis]